MDIFLTTLLILLSVILLFVGVCLFSRLRLKISVEKKNGENPVSKITLETMGGLIRRNLSDVRSKKGRKSKKAPQQTDFDTRRKISSYYQTFRKVKYIFSLTRHKVRKNILIEKLRLNIDFGLDDAAHTGIATGAVWTAIYNVVAFISSISRLTEPEIAVNPDFESEKLAFDGECIIVLRLANIINILFVIGMNYLTFKKQRKGGD